MTDPRLVYPAADDESLVTVEVRVQLRDMSLAALREVCDWIEVKVNPWGLQVFGATDADAGKAMELAYMRMGIPYHMVTKAEAIALGKRLPTLPPPTYEA